MPPMTMDERREISKIYSICGLLPDGQPLIGTRPFRSPHHSATVQAIAGGGRGPRPGEVSLATGGVLFLDELPEFPRSVIELLRQPLEDRSIVVARVSGAYRFSRRLYAGGCQQSMSLRLLSGQEPLPLLRKSGEAISEPDFPAHFGPHGSDRGGRFDSL